MTPWPYHEPCCPSCGVQINPGLWHTRSDGVYGEARSTHMQWHAARGES